MGTQTDNSRYTGYPLFKGLQRPLELMGLQGRYIYWAAGAVGGAILYPCLLPDRFSRRTAHFGGLSRRGCRIYPAETAQRAAQQEER